MRRYRSTVSLVLVEHPRPHVALVTLNRPERMNSMAFDVMVPLKEALENVTYDNSVRVVVLTGAGKGFSSGADHKSAGSVPHVQGLTRPIRSSRAFEIMLTGRDIDAEEAERIGLVSRQVPDDQLLETCFEMAERIAAFSRPGVELTKRTLWSGLDAASLEGHMQAEGLGQLFVRLLTGNFEEAVAARAEKRPPVFTDDKQ